MKILKCFAMLWMILFSFGLNSCNNKKVDAKKAAIDSLARDSPATVVSPAVDSLAAPSSPVIDNKEVVQDVEKKQAVINNVWVTKYSDYIKVHVSFSAKNMLNITGALVVYIVKQHDEQGDQNLFENTQGYRTYTFTPNYQDSEWTDYDRDIYYSDIINTVSNSSSYYKLYVKIFDDCDNLLATSHYASFSIE